jgi:hypothetical protein
VHLVHIAITQPCDCYAIATRLLCDCDLLATC